MSDIYTMDWRKLRIASFDLETTGLDVKNDRIVEIGIVIFEEGIPVEKYCKLINPEDKKINPKATKVTGITNEMVKDKKTFAERVKKIRRLLFKDVDMWCAFNDQFDRSFLMNELKRADYKFKDIPCIDPLVWARYWWPKMKNALDDVVQKLRIRVDPKVLRTLSINKSRHRADYDSLVTGTALFTNMQHMMPKTLRQTLYVQDFIYRMWLLNIHQNDKKYMRYLDLAMPPEHEK
ncbi:MAG: 3'-5' exonuclease [Candidatus Thorarchaeota archaeon]|nr:3'-5' exonuclease [Thermoplasmatales archaeon]